MTVVRESRARQIGIAVALALSVSFAWLVWPRGEPAPAAVRPAVTADALGAVPLQSAGADASRTGADRADAASEPRVAVDGVAGTAFTEPDSLGLLVVDAETRAPIAGAEVWFATWTDRDDTRSFDESLRQSLLRAADEEVDLRRHGRRTRTGTDGRCRVPFASWVRVAARAADRYGERFWTDHTDAEQVLPLRRDAPLVIEVRDAAGRPAAEVDVVWWAERADGARVRERLGATGADGRLVRAHAQTLRSADGADVVEVAAAPVGGTTPPRRVDLGAVPRTPVVFRLPPTGALTLQLCGSDGAPLTAAPYLTQDRRVQLSVDGEPNADWSLWLDRSGARRVAHVALDRRFTASFLRFNPQRQRFDGPTAERPEVAVDLRLAADTVTVGGRAVDAAGVPRGGRMLQFNFVDDDVYVGAMVETDDGGRFEAVLGGLRPGSRPRIELFAWSTEIDVPRPRASFVPDRPLVAGRNDLGDVTLDAGALLGAGTVRDQDGRPLDAIGLTVEHRTDDGWVYLQVEVEVDDGRFEIRGQAPPGQLRVGSGTIRFAPTAPVEFTAGATDIELKLVACGAFPFVLGIDDATPWTGLDLRLVARGDDDGGGRLRPLQADGPGRIRGRWDGVPPGRYRLEARLGHAAEPVVVVEDLVARPGEETLDPRLDPLDLTGLLDTARLRVVSATGEPVADAIALAPDPRGDGWCAFAPGADGAIVIPICGTVDRVDVLATGCEPATLRRVDGDRDVVLAPSPPWVIAFDLPAPWPEDVTATAVLQPVPPNPLAGASRRGVRYEPRLPGGGYIPNPGPVPGGGLEAAIDAGRRATFRPRAPGPYRLIVRLTSSAGRAADLDPAAAPLDWQPGRGAARIEVREAALRAAVAELGR